MRGSPGGAVLLLPRSLGLLVVLLTVAACTTGDDATAQRPPERPPVRVDASLGVVRVPAGSTVPVRMVLDTEGDAEGLAPIIEAAVRTAVEDFGGVQQGFRVDLGAIVATDCSQTGGERAAATLDTSGVVGILGPQCAATLLGLQSGLDGLEMAVVTPRVQDPTAGPTAWRTAPSLLHEARAAAGHAALGLGHTRGATLFDSRPEAGGLAEAFEAQFEALGGTVVVRQQIASDLDAGVPDQTQEVLAPALDAIVSGDVDVVFVALPEDLLLALGADWSSRSGLDGVVRIASSRDASPRLLGEETTLGHLFTGPRLDFPDAVSSVTGMSAAQTRERVASISGSRDPSGWWAYAYDAATLLLKAIEDASLVDVDGSFVVSRAELREVLGATGFDGITGSLRCTATGDCGAEVLEVREHQDPAATGFDLLPIVGTAQP